MVLRPIGGALSRLPHKAVGAPVFVQRIRGQSSYAYVYIPAIRRWKVVGPEGLEFGALQEAAYLDRSNDLRLVSECRP